MSASSRPVTYCRDCGRYGASATNWVSVGFLTRLPVLWRFAPMKQRPGFYCLDCDNPPTYTPPPERGQR